LLLFYKKFSIRLTCQQKLSISVHEFLNHLGLLYPPGDEIDRWLSYQAVYKRGIAKAIKSKLGLPICDAAVHSRTPTCGSAATKVEELQQSGDLLKRLQQESRLAVPKLNLAIQMLQSLNQE